MDDLISRKAAIDSICRTVCDNPEICESPCDEIKVLEIMPSAQPETHEERTETHACDLISRQVAIAEIARWIGYIDEDMINRIQIGLNRLPSAQPTLYGYNIEHLELIARVLQKEDLPPERVVEVLTDVGKIVAIVKDEFEEALRKAVEQCMT